MRIFSSNVSLWKHFSFFAFIQKYFFTIFNYYLLPAVSFCIYCFSAFCNWEAKSNDSAPSFITNSTFDLSASTDLSQRIMQVRWMKTGWLFPLPFSFSFVYQSSPSPSLSFTPDGIYFVFYIDVNRIEEYGCRTFNRCLIFSWFYTSVIYEVSGM